MLYMVTFTINIPPMLAYIPYMDPMGYSLLLSSCPPLSTQRVAVFVDCHTDSHCFDGSIII